MFVKSRFSGNFISLEELMRITLKTGKHPKGRGFRALYRTSDATSIEEKIIILKNDTSGKNSIYFINFLNILYKLISGILLHLNFPQQSPPNLDFLQRFIAPPGYIISIELHSVKLTHTECTDGNGLIEVFDNYSDTNGTLWKLCYQSVDEQRGNVLLKTFKFSY